MYMHAPNRLHYEIRKAVEGEVLKAHLREGSNFFYQMLSR
jgi:hypothetical protein